MKKHIIILLLLFFVLLQTEAQFFGSESVKIPEVKIQVNLEEKDLKPGSTFTVNAKYEIPPQYHMFLNKDLFNININNVELIAFDTLYPLDEAEELLGQPAFSGTVTISRAFKIPENTDPGSYNLEINADYQICEDDGTCLLPSTKSFSKTISINTADGKSINWLNFISIIQYILMAFAGGLILNIMPCVLPLLSVKTLNLVSQSHQDKKIILKSALVYALGILASFLFLAIIVIILKSSGEYFGWGFQFQNPLFVLSLITVIFIFSLSLFDVFTINAPTQGITKASAYSAGQSYRGSFFTGIFAVLVATPCTAPFMGAALAFAFTQTPAIIIAIFTSLSIGFALPFVLLGVFPQLIKKLPKPGNWMNTFKDFMGFLLLGTSVYLLTSLYGLIGSSIKGIIWFLLFTGFAVWVFGKFGSIIEKKSKRVISLIIALLIISVSAFLFVDLSPDKNTDIKQSETWGKFSTELVETYRAENEAVFIDFYADWCTTCKVNDAVVLNTEYIQNLFDEKNVHLLKGDFTAGDKEIARWLSEYKRAGVPLYILFRPGEEAVLFPELLTRSMIEKELNLIKQ